MKFRKIINSGIATGSLILWMLTCPGNADAANQALAASSFVVDLGIKRQTIDNFGANDAWAMQKIGAWSETNKNRIADLLFSTNKGIGLSLWRFNLGAGINRETIYNDWRTVETFEIAEGKYDWTRQANERWFLRAATERGSARGNTFGIRHFQFAI